MAKYYQRAHPLVKQWYSGQSQSWNAMCKIKRIVDHNILWFIHKGDKAVWFDNWTNLGPLCNFLPEGSKHRNVKISDILVDGNWHWEGWDVYFPDYLRSTINKLQIYLNPNRVDKPVWTSDNKGNFSVASAWNLFKNKKNKNWVDSTTWHKFVPFKMNFIVWRALTDKLLTDARVSRMGITTTFRCCCCRIPSTEGVEHLFCSVAFAQEV